MADNYLYYATKKLASLPGFAPMDAKSSLPY